MANGIGLNSTKGKTRLSLFIATTVILQALRLSLLSLFFYYYFFKHLVVLGQ